MIVTIYYKNSQFPVVSYRMALDEFRRLAADYEKFLREGDPDQGVYICHTVHGDPELKTPKETLLKFPEIAVIA